MLPTVPNQPNPETVSTSFTLPRNLLELVENTAAREMTNKSDIIRRALMNFLTPAERLRVAEEIGATIQIQQGNGNNRQSVNYAKRGKKKKPPEL